MNTFALKIIATIAMVLDHIAYFFPQAPLAFHWIGRISAPIFIFCVINGVIQTHSQTKYCLRLYIASIIMSILQTYFNIPLNFLRTLFIICILFCIVENCKKNNLSTKKYLAIYIFYQIFTCVICGFLIQTSNTSNEMIFTYLLPAILGSIFATNGGLIYITIGIIFYVFYNKRTYIAISYSALAFIYSTLMITSFVSSALYRINVLSNTIGSVLYASYEYILPVLFDMDVTLMGGNMLFDNYQWMMIFALIPILKYNGKRGFNIKYSFYLFYPLHITILWLISYT